jgi:hypothetical protein
MMEDLRSEGLAIEIETEQLCDGEWCATVWDLAHHPSRLRDRRVIFKRLTVFFTSVEKIQFALPSG